MVCDREIGESGLALPAGIGPVQGSLDGRLLLSSMVGWGLSRSARRSQHNDKPPETAGTREIRQAINCWILVGITNFGVGD